MNFDFDFVYNYRAPRRAIFILDEVLTLTFREHGNFNPIAT